MNIITATTNSPFGKATAAAYAELTTPEAMQWYKETGYNAYLILGTLATLAYILIETWLLDITEIPVIAPPLDTPIAGLLMPAKEVAPTPRPLIKDDILDHLRQQMAALPQLTHTTDADPLESLTVAQLKQRLDDAGIVYPRKATKAKLIDLLLVTA